MTDHISDFQLDRLLGGELPAPAYAELLAHTDACAACKARYQALLNHKTDFELLPLPPLLMARRPQRARWPWLMSLAVALGAVTLWFVLQAPVGSDASNRSKGRGVRLELYVGHASQTQPLQSGATLTPGDKLQAVYSASVPGYGAVLARDGAGLINVYVPTQGQAMVALAPGSQQPFPSSTELDEVLGEETVIVVWCEQARSLTPWHTMLTQQQQAEITGCESKLVRFRKVAAP